MKRNQLQWTKAIVVVIALICIGPQVSNSAPFDFLETINSLLGYGMREDGERLNPIDRFLLDVVPTWFGQAPNNINGTMSEFREYALADESNDDARHLSVQQLVTRSGYQFELYDAIADDGYITILTRIINPLADRRRLRQPPVLMEHGGTIDPSAYMIGSSIQHFPERWPRTPGDGPIKSWNRSLAFVLANNGFDVWLAETRGSNDINERRIRTRSLESTLEGKNEDKNRTAAENLYEIFNMWNYWSFSQDDIIAHELKSHIDTVLKVTGSEKLHVFTYSLSTPTSLAFLGMRPDYAVKVQGFVSMAPIVSGEGVNKLIKLILQYLCPILPDSIGTLLITDLLLTQPVRNLVIATSYLKSVRYSWVKMIATLLMGASAKWRTLLDLNVMGHMLRQLSFKEAKQLCQQTKANKLQKYDYGPIRNRVLYNSTEPPVYDISDLKIRDWIVLSAQNDALSTPAVIDHLLRMVSPKPIAHIVAPGFNHLDLIAAADNDIYVNLPILRYFERMSFDQNEDGFDDSKGDFMREASTLNIKH